MQAIMEPVFEIFYLIAVIFLGFWTLRRAGERRQFRLFGIMAIVLGSGDAFHLIPRIWFLLTSGTASLEEQAAVLGFGKLVTSLSMTVFYVMLYHVWQLRYQMGKKVVLTLGIYGLAIVRVVLCLMPQNQWLSANPPILWGILRNIPFVIMGLMIIFLYYSSAQATKDQAFRRMWLAITLSFMFYIPVVLFAGAFPVVGALMIPKTCAYLWIVFMGFWDSGKKKEFTPIPSESLVG